MEDEIDHILSRAESKFCTPSGSTCTSKAIGLLVRRHIVAGEFHYIGKEASTRWASGPDLSRLKAARADRDSAWCPTPLMEEYNPLQQLRTMGMLLRAELAVSLSVSSVGFPPFPSQ